MGVKMSYTFFNVSQHMSEVKSGPNQQLLFYKVTNVFILHFLFPAPPPPPHVKVSEKCPTFTPNVHSFTTQLTKGRLKYQIVPQKPIKWTFRVSGGGVRLDGQTSHNFVICFK